MVRTANLPSHRLHFRLQPLNDGSIDAIGGSPASFFTNRRGRSPSSIAGDPHLHRPSYHAHPFDQRECYGSYDSRDSFDRQPPDQCRDSGLGGLSASVSPPPFDRRASHRLDTPIARTESVLSPACHMGLDTSSRRPLRLRRGSDVSPVPSPSTRTRSPQRESYREHHHRARYESRSRSPRLHLPLRGSKSLPSSKPRRLDDGRKESKSVPSSKRYRLDEGRNASSSSAHWYDDNEGAWKQRSYGDGGNTRSEPTELSYPSSCDHGPNPGVSRNNSSPWYHGKRSFSTQPHSSSRKPPLPLPIEMSPQDDGYKSPSSPTYRWRNELELDIGRDWPDSASGACDGLEVAGREPNFKYEDPIHKKEKEDSAYGALVDDFMDVVLKNWRKPVIPDLSMDKEAYQKQTNRFAELALKRYNKDRNNKVKYSLVEAVVGAAIFEDSKLYAHVNFYANAKNGPKKSGPKELIFAELHQVGQRPNAMVLTSFHLLDEENQFPGCRDQVRSYHTTEDEDIYHCYACSDKIKHPKGSFYKAGHFTDALSYLND